MNLMLECPGCGTSLLIDRAQSLGPVACGVCQQVFDPSQANPREVGPTAIPTGQPVNQPPAGTPVPVGSLVENRDASHDASANPNALGSSITIRNRRSYRKKKNPWLPVLGLLGLIAVVVALGAFALREQPKSPKLAASPKKELKPAKPKPRAKPRKRVRVSRPPRRAPVVQDDSPVVAEPEPEIDLVQELLETLDRSGRQCEAFQFLPEEETQYRQLQTFARQIALGQTLLTDGYPNELEEEDEDEEDEGREISPEDRQAITEKMTHWQQTATALIRGVASHAPRRLERFNTFAKQEMEQGNTFDRESAQTIFYGFLFLGEEERPQAILKFDRKQVYFSVPKAPEISELPDEAYRMFFLEMPEVPQQKRMNSPGGGLLRARDAKLVYVVDPLGTDE